MITKEEMYLLRELAKQYKELAVLPEQKEHRDRARNINSLVPERPVVWIDEIPWHEMDIDGQLQLRCQDAFARDMEKFFRQTLYRWQHIRADMVIEDFYSINKAFSSTGLGVEVADETIAVDDHNNIVSHHYIDLLDTEEKLAQFHNPIITPHPAQDSESVALAEEILNGILPVKLRGSLVYFAPWDQICFYRGVEPILIDMMDRPEFLHKIIDKFVSMEQFRLNQMEEYGLLDYDTQDLHCTPPYVNDLPGADYDGGKVLMKHTWFRTMAQMFSGISPAMHEEFDLAHTRVLAEQFGLTYYGCCEPLHDRIDMLRKIPNMRKIGVSPWADVRKSAEAIGGDYVYAHKPNPAFVSGDWNSAAVEKEITDVILACKEHGCAYEFVLKDISTVSYKPQNLIEWNRLVQQIIDRHYR